MAANLGQLTLDLIAKIGGFTGPMDQASRISEKRMKEISKHASAAGKAIGAAATIVAGAGAVWIKSAIDTAAEVSRLAQVSNASTTEFQKAAYAAQSVGIEQDKLADIFKDVNDKVGDFLVNGAGPLADFFDKVAPQVGVTAEQFRNLSGPDALGLYVDTLEKAGANQQEMTFFMEAIASDATTLIPLLQNGGEKMRGLATEAENLGVVLSDETIKGAKQFNDDLAILGRVVNSVGQNIAAELLPELTELTKELRDPETAKAAAAMAKAVVGSFTDIINGAKNTVKFIQWAAESAAAFMNGIAADDLVRLNDELDRLQKMKASGALDRLVFFGRDGIVEYYDDEELDAEIAKIQGAIQAAMNSGPPVTVPVEPILSGGSSGTGLNIPPSPTGKSTKSAREAVDAIQSQIDALKVQAATLEMTTQEQTLFKLALDGATQSQLDQAAAAFKTIEAYEAKTEALKKAADEQARINQEAIGIADSLASEEEQILKSYERRRQIILDNTEITGNAQTELLRKLEEQRNEDMLEINGSYWERWLESAEGSLTNFDELAASVVENFSSQVGSAFESMVFDAQTLDESISNLAEGMARSIVNALGQMAAQWLAYQAVQLLVGKTTQASAATSIAANATAMSLTAGVNAFASAAAIPIVGWAAAPGAMAAALAVTGPVAAAAGAAALAGMAHDGIDKIPATGSWYLEKGERVTTAETSAKLDATLSRIQSGMNEEGAGRTGSGRSITVNQTNNYKGVGDNRTASQANSDLSRKMRVTQARLGK